MYKFRQGSAQLSRFNEVFANQITVKKVSVGLMLIASLILILLANSYVFANTQEVDAVTQEEPKIASNPNCPTNYLSNPIFGKEICNWNCNPRDINCYTREDPASPGHYDAFNLLVRTSMGDATGEAFCQDPGLCEPGNYDILKCYEHGGT